MDDGSGDQQKQQKAWDGASQGGAGSTPISIQTTTTGTYGQSSHATHTAPLQTNQEHQEQDVQMKNTSEQSEMPQPSANEHNNGETTATASEVPTGTEGSSGVSDATQTQSQLEMTQQATVPIPLAGPSEERKAEANNNREDQEGKEKPMHSGAVEQPAQSAHTDQQQTAQQQGQEQTPYFVVITGYPPDNQEKATQVSKETVAKVGQKLLHSVPHGNYKPQFQADEPNFNQVDYVIEASSKDNQTFYCCKFRGCSHLHVKWYTNDQLLRLDPSNGDAVAKFEEEQPPLDQTRPPDCTKVAQVFARRFVCRCISVGSPNRPGQLRWTRQYLVQWKNLPRSEATWEDEEALMQDPHNTELVRGFEQSGRAAVLTTTPPEAVKQQIIRCMGGSMRQTESHTQTANGQQPSQGNSAVATRKPGNVSRAAAQITDPSNIFKRAVVDTLEAIGMKVQQLQDLVASPPHAIQNWLYGKGRIDEFVEKGIKDWLVRKCPDRWASRLREVLNTVANRNDRFREERLLMRRYLGLNYDQLPMIDGGLSSKEETDKIAEGLAESEEKDHFIPPEKEILGRQIDLGRVNAGRHLESYAIVPNRVLHELFEGLEDALSEEESEALQKLQKQLMAGDPYRPESQISSLSYGRIGGSLHYSAPNNVYMSQVDDSAQDANGPGSKESEPDAEAKETSEERDDPRERAVNAYQKQLLSVSTLSAEERERIVADEEIIEKRKQLEQLLYHFHAAKETALKLFFDKRSGCVPPELQKMMRLERLPPTMLLPTSGPQPYYDFEGSSNSQDLNPYKIPHGNTLSADMLESPEGMPAASSTSIYLGGNWFPRGLSRGAFVHSYWRKQGLEKAADQREVNEQIEAIWRIYVQLDGRTRDSTIWNPQAGQSLDKLKNFCNSFTDEVGESAKKELIANCDTYMDYVYNKWKRLLQQVPDNFSSKLKKDAQLQLQQLIADLESRYERQHPESASSNGPENHHGVEYTGVKKLPSGLFEAQIYNSLELRNISLGTFESAEDAARAYNQAAKAYGLSSLNNVPEKETTSAASTVSETDVRMSTSPVTGASASIQSSSVTAASSIDETAEAPISQSISTSVSSVVNDGGTNTTTSSVPPSVGE